MSDYCLHSAASAALARLQATRARAYRGCGCTVLLLDAPGVFVCQSCGSRQESARA